MTTKSLLAFKARVRELTSRTCSRTMRRIMKELWACILGWRGYHGFTEVTSPVLALDK